jgi:hypothetical protein
MAKSWGILNKRLPHVLLRTYPTDCEEAARDWSYSIEDDDEDKAEEAVINGQGTGDVVEQVQINFSAQNEETTKEDQEEK